MTDKPAELELVLWEGCVRAHPLAEQMAAAVAGGFDALSISLPAARSHAAQGVSVERMRAMAQDHGLRFSDLDGGVGFMPIRLPTGASERMVQRFDHAPEEALDLAEALGVSRLCTVGLFDHGTYTLEAMTGGFADLCDAAAKRDLAVSLEPLAFFGVQDVATACGIVKGAARTNGSVLFDTWHFTRSTNRLADLEKLADCGWIDVQVDDGPRELAGATLMEDTVDFRRFPGEGDFALVDHLRAIDPDQIRSIGVEVFSKAADRMPAVEAGRRAGQTLRRVAAQAGLSLPDRRA